ncbi:MAG: hypothetical protein DRH24_01245 [Deltaproteobacteria bacterium]|nr:MAG: hypothetical protein DRH24_01245 [Deltaproteobacteria bacterium]
MRRLSKEEGFGNGKYGKCTGIKAYFFVRFYTWGFHAQKTVHRAHSSVNFFMIDTLSKVSFIITIKPNILT